MDINNPDTLSKQQIRKEPQGKVEYIFETILFNCRFLVLVPVLGILVASIVMFYKGCVEIVQGIRAFKVGYLAFQPTPIDDQNVITSFIPAVDNYLFAIILLIISMGLYELFISKIDPPSMTKTRPLWLRIRDLDDLTSRIGEVVIMILIVNFFKNSFGMKYEQPKDLLILGGAVLLISGSLVVTHYISSHRKERVN